MMRSRGRCTTRWRACYHVDALTNTKIITKEQTIFLNCSPVHAWAAGEACAARPSVCVMCDITSTLGFWDVAREHSNATPPTCSAAELFAAGLKYPQVCATRCWWHPEAECLFSRVEHDSVPECLRGRWLIFVGDSQVRNLCRFLARWLGFSRRLPDSMHPSREANDSAMLATYYDDCAVAETRTLICSKLLSRQASSLLG